LITVETIAAARAQVHEWRTAGARIAFVATMGNLHDGHLSLVRAARSLADRVVASIFVNPLQFGPTEDFGAYPRTLEDDQAALETSSCDLLFAPSAAEMYPDGQPSTRLTVGLLGSVLCGAHRVGHFDGMATVVAKLLNIVQPDFAVFGQKDFQQLAVIRRFVADLNLPVSIVGVPTVRENDGLAMSSRNRYLGELERKKAPLLYATLLHIGEQILNGTRDYEKLCRDAKEHLSASGFGPDYVEVRDSSDLSQPDETAEMLVILAAATLGRARLIDNIQVDLRAESLD